MLLDRDRVDQDIEAGRDPRPSALNGNITLVFQEPNLEGLLLRLHPGMERKSVSAHNAEAELKKVWPDYRKPPTAHQLKRRFSVSDLQRAARHDGELEKLLRAPGLLTPPSGGTR